MCGNKNISLQKRNENFKMRDTLLKVMDLLNTTGTVKVYIVTVSRFSFPLHVDQYLCHLELPTKRYVWNYIIKQK